MFTNSNFFKNLDILHRNMDVSVIRRDVISNNIANSDTPNFKRSEINFETQLKKVLEEQRNPKYVLNFDRDNSCKFAFKKKGDYSDVKPVRSLDYLTQSKNNGNNVDAEEEMMLALKNQLSYEMMLKSTGSMFNNVRTVLAR